MDPKSAAEAATGVGRRQPNSPISRGKSGLLQSAPLSVLFSLDAPPPVQIPAQELIQDVTAVQPAALPVPCPSCSLSREACVLCVHAFWYTFCCLCQPNSEPEQQALLKMMSHQVRALALTAVLFARWHLRLAFAAPSRGPRPPAPPSTHPPYVRSWAGSNCGCVA